MATSTAKPTNIFNLSTELQQAIIEKTDRTGIKSIRLACRELSAAADYVFIEEFFTTREHLLTPNSLQVLIEITKTPRLCKSMHYIGFVHLDPGQYLVTFPDDADGVLTKWYDTFRVMKNRAIQMIREILQNLSKADISPSFGIESPPTGLDEPDCGNGCYGLERFKRELQAAANGNEVRIKQDVQMVSNDIEVKWLLCSIMTAKYQVRCLDLCLEQPKSDLESPWHLGDGFTLALRECFSNLTSVSLRFDPFTSWRSVGVYEKLHTALAGSVALKEVSLGVLIDINNWESYQSSMGEEVDDSFILRSVISSLPNVESLDLHHCQVLQASLHELLGSSAKTLKKLSLFRVAIEPTAKWKDTLLWIAKTCTQVDQFTTHTLFQGSEKLQQRIQIDSETSMAEKIRELAEDAEFAVEPFQIGTPSPVLESGAP